MKPSLLIALLLPLSATVYSQQSPSLLLSMEAKRKSGNHLGVDTSQPETYLKKMDLQRLRKGGLINATYSHSTARGKVYQLTPDNMPCLVPDRQAVATIPNGFRGGNPDKKMNRIPEIRIIPLEGEADKKEAKPDK